MCFGKVAGAPLVPFEYREWDELWVEEEEEDEEAVDPVVVFEVSNVVDGSHQIFDVIVSPAEFVVVRVVRGSS